MTRRRQYVLSNDSIGKAISYSGEVVQIHVAPSVHGGFGWAVWPSNGGRFYRPDADIMIAGCSGIAHRESTAIERARRCALRVMRMYYAHHEREARALKEEIRLWERTPLRRRTR